RLAERVVEQAARRPDERAPLAILAVARLLPDEHDLRALASFAEDCPGRVLPERQARHPAAASLREARVGRGGKYSAIRGPRTNSAVRLHRTLQDLGSVGCPPWKTDAFTRSPS